MQLLHPYSIFLALLLPFQAHGANETIESVDVDPPKETNINSIKRYPKTYIVLIIVAGIFLYKVFKALRSFYYYCLKPKKSKPDKSETEKPEPKKPKTDKPETEKPEPKKPKTDKPETEKPEPDKKIIVTVKNNDKEIYFDSLKSSTYISGLIYLIEESLEEKEDDLDMNNYDLTYENKSILEQGASAYGACLIDVVDNTSSVTFYLKKKQPKKR